MTEHHGKAHHIERLYLDFDSFFATAEQHFNPALRGRPVGVLPIDSPNTSCIAVSREAKACGVKFGSSVTAAREILPDMVFVIARHDVYVRLHNRIISVIENCLPVANVRSIDEVVCHLLPCEADEGAALAARIKQALRYEFSDVLTCSIGMAPTELLAKIGAEMCKPNGFTIIKPEDLPAKLNHLDLNDLPGISRGIKARLNAAGIHDFNALWTLGPKHARALWGNVEGERFWNGLHGYHIERPATVKRMFGHSRILPIDWRNTEKIRICGRLLLMSASRRLRRTDLSASKLSLAFRGRRKDSTKSVGWQWDISFLPSRDDYSLLKALSQGLHLADQQLTFRPRSVSVMLHGLADQRSMTQDLFSYSAQESSEARFALEKSRKDQWERVSQLIDHLRSLHGPKIISHGMANEIPGGYLGAKIAFGRIPDAADFSGDFIPDEATHFCSY